MEYITNPRHYFAYILISTTCRNLETGMVAAMMATIKADLTMSYTMEVCPKKCLLVWARGSGGAKHATAPIVL